MDMKLCKELSEYTDKLTTSGESQLDKDVMKSFKKICKKSDDYVKYAHGLIMTQLDKEHAEIRLSAFQICDELFNRSHVFRELILSEFQEFMNLTIEASPHRPLPPPVPAAKQLKATALPAIHAWNDKYGSDYKQLSLGFNFLKHCKKIDFATTRARTQAEEQAHADKQKRLEEMRRNRLESVLKEMAENSLNVKDILLQIENSLKLLLPDPENFQIHGLMSPDHTPSYHNPFRSYTHRTEAEISISETSVKKTTDASKIKGQKLSQKVKLEPKDAGEETDAKNTDEARPAGETTRSPDTLTGYVIEPQSARVKCEKNEPQTIQTSTELISRDDSNLVRPIDDDFKEASSPSSSDDELEEEDVVRDHGLLSHHYRIQVEINPEKLSIQETEDNTDILHTLRDLTQEVTNKIIPQVQRWLEVMSKTGAEQSVIKKAIDMKTALELAKKRTTSYSVIEMPKAMSETKDEDDADTDDDSDFIDVPCKEGYEDDVPEFRRPKPRSAHEWQITQQRKNGIMMELDPTTSQATIMKLLCDLKASKVKSSLPVPARRKATSATTKSAASSRVDLSKVPVVPFGTDLLNWGEKRETPLSVKYESSHRFWHSTLEDSVDTVDKAALESMNKRFINFTGEFEPVKWSCRVPLQNGTLCQRKDRVKCPFHGKIIARNNMGQPEHAEDCRRLAKEEYKKREDNVAEWEDPLLQAEIEAATGEKLNPGGSKAKGKGKAKAKAKKRKQATGLTNISKSQSTSKSRLEKLVLSPKARKRVEENMSNINNRKYHDKFGNNFAYALN